MSKSPRKAYKTTMPPTANKRSSPFLLAVVLTLSCQAIAATPKTTNLDLALPAGPHTTIGKWVTMIYDEACRRVGVDYKFRNYPGRRATLEAITGRSDGEFIRAFTYLDDKPNLRRVDQAVLNLRYTALSKDPSISLNDWSSLSDTPYTLGYLRGTHLTEHHLHKRVPASRLKSYTSIERGLEALREGRVDVFVGVELSMLHLQHAESHRHQQIYVAGLMDTQAQHLYLHKQHQDLVPAFNRAFTEMKQEKLIERYRDIAIGRTNDGIHYAPGSPQ